MKTTGAPRPASCVLGKALSLLMGAGLMLAAVSCMAEYRAGMAVTDITPAQSMLDRGETYMGGYGLWTQRGTATGVHDPLSARALFIGDDHERLCIVVLDSLGVPGPVIDEIRRLASGKTGMDADNILVGATHTHAAPDLLGLWGGSPDAYRRILIEQAVATVVQAAAAAQPALLSYGIGQGKARNRRGWGFTDDALIVIQAVSHTGEPIATLVNFAAHPVVTPRQNLQISSDYVHYLREMVQRESGAPVIYINGAIGDASPSGERGDDYWRAAKRYGESLAAEALGTLDSTRPVDTGIVLKRRTFRIQVDNLVLSLAENLGLLNEDISGPFWDVSVESSVAYLALGAQVQGIAVPGEALTRLGLAMKKRLYAPAKLFLGLSGGSLGYFVPADEWQTGRNNDYEESVSIGRQIAGQLEKSLADIIPGPPPI